LIRINSRRTINLKVDKVIQTSYRLDNAHGFCVVFLKKFGIAVKFVNSDDPSELAAAIDEKTKAVFVESIGNPKYNVCPIREIAKVCYLYLCVPVKVLRQVAGCA
jgi:O-acetylhomoserine/O-acetylserine sulfhydrylase